MHYIPDMYRENALVKTDTSLNEIGLTSNQEGLLRISIFFGAISTMVGLVITPFAWHYCINEIYIPIMISSFTLVAALILSTSFYKLYTNRVVKQLNYSSSLHELNEKLDYLEERISNLEDSE